MNPWTPENLAAARRLAAVMSVNQMEHQMYLAAASRKESPLAEPDSAGATEKRSGVVNDDATQRITAGRV